MLKKSIRWKIGLAQQKAEHLVFRFLIGRKMKTKHFSLGYMFDSIEIVWHIYKKKLQTLSQFSLDIYNEFHFIGRWFKIAIEMYLPTPKTQMQRMMN